MALTRRESLASAADRLVPFPTAARLAGVDVGGRAKVHCLFWAEHDDGGREPALRVYDDHGYCFAEQKYFSVTGLLSLAWEVSREDAGARALREIGWRPVSYSHLWDTADRPPEPDRDALRAALHVWCAGRCPDWEQRQFDPAAADRLARCLGLLRLVSTAEDCTKWLAACKQAMAPYLS
jgi:hypothetical protein